MLFRWKISNPILVAATAIVGLIAFRSCTPPGVREVRGMESNLKILFVCTHGSAKSLMAAHTSAASQHSEAWRSRPRPQGRNRTPRSTQRAHGLQEDGIDVQGYQPRRVTRGELAAAWR